MERIIEHKGKVYLIVDKVSVCEVYNGYIDVKHMKEPQVAWLCKNITKDLTHNLNNLTFIRQIFNQAHKYINVNESEPIKDDDKLYFLID